MVKRRSLLETHIFNERGRNNLAILELIRRQGPITRTEISQGTGLNIVTVSNYVSYFIRKNLVVEKGFDVSAGGRRPTLVELNARAAYCLGIDLGSMDGSSSDMVAVLTDLSGHLAGRVSHPRGKESIEKVLGSAAKLIDELLAKAKVDRKRIAGVGIGLAGVINEASGTVRDTSPGGIRSSYVAVRDKLEASFQIPVFIGNDATFAALGEMRLGLNRSVRNMIYMLADVGCGIIVHGQLYWGSGGCAGEATLNFPSENDYLTWTKSAANFLPQGIDLGIPAQAKKLLQQGVDSPMKSRRASLTLDDVIQAAKEGDTLAVDVIEHCAIGLGIRIAYLVNLLNPDVVVIGGGAERAGSFLLEPVFRTVRRWAFEEPASHVDIVPGQLGSDAVAMGAASFVGREIFVQA